MMLISHFRIWNCCTIVAYIIWAPKRIPFRPIWSDLVPNLVLFGPKSGGIFPGCVFSGGLGAGRGRCRLELSSCKEKHGPLTLLDVWVKPSWDTPMSTPPPPKKKKEEAPPHPAKSGRTRGHPHVQVFEKTRRYSGWFSFGFPSNRLPYELQISSARFWMGLVSFDGIVLPVPSIFAKGLLCIANELHAASSDSILLHLVAVFRASTACCRKQHTFCFIAHSERSS